MAFETIRDAATGGSATKPAKTTVLTYRDVLERIWILDPVEAWLPARNRLRTLTVGPRHHLAAPALAARLLGVDARTAAPTGSRSCRPGRSDRDTACDSRRGPRVRTSDSP
ncbi:MAG: hypothetical protein ACKOOF_05230 [Planctomycetaceae bacterium]